MTSLISLYIDDEMNLDEKIEFVETVRDDDFFARETLVFLDQEKVLCQNVAAVQPRFEWKAPFSLKRFIKPLGLGAVAVASLILFLTVYWPRPYPAAQSPSNRFIIYRPDVSQVEITGTFTKWTRIPMKKIGDSGYWEISLGVSAGEHRYTYILDGRDSYADPTRLTRETDDFGGQNSIMRVEEKA